MNQRTESSQPQIRWRVVLLGLGLIVVNNYWVFGLLRWRQGYPTTMSLFFNAIFILTVLVVLNYGLARFSPKLALKQGELLTLYTMLSIASAICGHDLFEVILTRITAAGWRATEENEWATLFHRYLPDWLAMKDKNRLTTYFAGESSLYTLEHLRFWWRPAFAWSGFIIVLLFTALCINVILRKQWIEAERLSYPVIELPYQITSTGFFRNRWMWVGLILAGGMDLINGLHFLYPFLPGLGGEFYNLGPLFTTKPWDAIGWTPIVVFPFAIGMAYFIPLDFSFAIWFFYIFWKLEMIMGSALGFQHIPEFPFIYDQSFGVCVGILLLVLWGGRRHLRNVLKQALWNPRTPLLNKESSGEAGTKPLPRGSGMGTLAKEGSEEVEAKDAGEPISYRGAVLGLICGLFVLIAFWTMVGMSIWVACLVLAIHFTTVIVITRMRAELGPPAHDLRLMGPDLLIPKIFGMRKIGPRNLTLFSLVYCFNRAYRGSPMPHQLEGFKLAERAHVSSRRLVVAMLLAIVLGALVSFWVSLHISYKSGGIGARAAVFNRTQSWLTNPLAVDIPAIMAMLFGLIFTFVLTLVRLCFIWCPLYPVAYAISGTWAMGFFWFSVLISYWIKLCLLRFGGLKVYHRAAPFFLGLILGEFLVGSGWGLIGVFLEKPMYRFIW